ncbi:MAG: UbiX family flavin prenyltransferase [Planctomycetes bacterium]|nr:UbiX family flavin prenyltransferase [Planctomycetota bacterium]
MSSSRVVVAVTGASGSAYALRLLGHLEDLGQPVDLVVSPSAGRVLDFEGPGDRTWFDGSRPLAPAFGLTADHHRAFGHQDIAAPIASGTALRGGMVVVPCSMGTLGRMAHGISGNLIERAADVCLKERRRLVLVPRETPLSLIQLRNMVSLTEAGAMILPASPGFYARTRSIDDLLDHVCGKILDALGLEHEVSPRWGGGA